jgi:hypothetical protein
VGVLIAERFIDDAGGNKGESMSKLPLSILIVLAIVVVMHLDAAKPGGNERAKPGVPIVHSTDLFHPHCDPDDHYDLAYLMAVGEFDVRGIILDDHRPDGTQAKQSGRPPIEQMMHITGKKVPIAVGLQAKMRSRDDKMLDAPEAGQEGVRLLLSVLRETNEKVVLNLVGSLCDAVVAFNREPELMRQKIKAIYVHAGNGPDGVQDEYNVTLDPNAYVRVLESGLPIYWCPCFGKQGYATYFVVADESVLIRACAQPVQNYFVYCLTRSKEDPIRFLSSGPHPIPTGKRNMWCVAPMIHAAGRKIYERGSDDFVALTPENAQKAGLAAKEIKVFEFAPVQFDTTHFPVLRTDRRPVQSNQCVFRITDSRYEKVLCSVLKNLLAGLSR